MATMDGNTVGPPEPVEALAVSRALHLIEKQEEMDPTEFQQYLSEYMSATNELMDPSYREHVENPTGSFYFLEFNRATRDKIYDFAIGDVIYPCSTVYDYEELDELPQESIAFGKDWHYFKKPAGSLKNLLSVCKQIRYEILEHTIKTRTFLFGDIYAFLAFFRRPVLHRPSFHPWTCIRKVEIMLFRDGVQLLPMSRHLVDLVLEEHEENISMPTPEWLRFQRLVSNLRLEEFKLTIRDGFALVGTNSIRRLIYNGLIHDMYRWINRQNYPLHFVNGHRECVEVEFLDDTEEYPQNYFFEL